MNLSNNPKISSAAAAILISICFSIFMIQTADSRRVRANFIGLQACGKCHESNAIGNQNKLWLGSPHARAFQILRTERAREIAAKIGINNPIENINCLKCHTTGGGKSPATMEEGVGCEACHGPGSRYFEFSNHASFDNRERAYRKAVKLGMYPIIGIDGIKAREKLCRHCHNEKRPCIPEKRDERNRQKLALSIIADFVFKHPVRR